MRTQHALVIPVDGVLSFLHSQDPIHTENTMRTMFDISEATVFITIRFLTTTADHAMIGFFPGVGDYNARARDAFRMLTGASVVFTGPVILTGVPSHRLGDIVATLAMED